MGLRFESVRCGGKMWQRVELHPVRKQRVTDTGVQLALSSIFSAWPWAMAWCHPDLKKKKMSVENSAGERFTECVDLMFSNVLSPCFSLSALIQSLAT